MMNAIIYYVLRNLSLVLCKILFWITSIGAKNIPRKDGFILASNHASFLDPIILGVACPRVLNYMARDTLFRNKFFAWLLTSVNSFPLKRSSADLSAIKEAIKRLKNGGGLVLFPGGTRTIDEKINSFLEGVGFLAIKSQTPVIPVYIRGSNLALPKGAKFIRPTKITVFFGDKICPEDFSELSEKEAYAKITAKVSEKISNLISQNK